MSGAGKATGLSDEDETKVFPGLFGADNKKLSAFRKSLKRTKESVEALHSNLEDLVPLLSAAASGSAAGDLHVSSEEESAQRPAKQMRRVGPDLQQLVQELLASSSEKQQVVLPSAAQEDLNDSSDDSSSPEPPLAHPPYPKSGKTREVLNWKKECKRIDYENSKGFDVNLPTVRAPKDHHTTMAVQDWRSKKKVLAAARSVVNITPISEDGSTRMQFSGFILDRYEHGGIQFSVIVTCSSIVCEYGRKLDPLPKLSVGLPDRKTTIEAKLFHFSAHYDIAFLLFPMETSLDIPRFGCCPDYSQEVFVLGRDKDASLRVRRGVISWTEESDYIGCSHYMFLDGEVPQCGTGGPVIDHDGNFRGMAFKISPMPAILSISTIMTCFEMFSRFGRIARPIHGLSLRTVASVDVELLECISDYNLKSGYIVDIVDLKSPALKYKICKGNVIVSLNGHTKLSLPKLEDYLLSLGWQNLIYSTSTVDLKLEVCDLMKGRRRLITVPMGFCSAPERPLDNEV